MKKPNINLLGFIAVLVALTPSPAVAGNFNAVLNGKSYHFNSTYDWNENNYGIGLEYEFSTDTAWKKIAMANGFRDSNNKMSYMAGVGLHRRLFETDRFSGFNVYAGVSAFVMTRDDVNDNRPFPGILPSVSVGNRNIGVNLMYIPRKALQKMVQADMIDPTISGILFVQFKVSLSQLLP